MIVALSFGNTEHDTQSVMVIDTKKCTKMWQHAIAGELGRNGVGKEYALPDEWESLKKAQVTLPAKVRAACHVYYDG